MWSLHDQSDTLCKLTSCSRMKMRIPICPYNKDFFGGFLKQIVEALSVRPPNRLVARAKAPPSTRHT